MKITLFLLLSSQLIWNYKEVKKSQIEKITVIYANYSFETPIATSKTEFWKNKKYFYSIEIKSANLCAHLESKFRNLKVISNAGFDHRVAVILKMNRSIDTLYTEQFFEYWNKGNISLKDESGYFKTVFGPYLIRNIE